LRERTEAGESEGLEAEKDDNRSTPEVTEAAALENDEEDVFFLARRYAA
jgi:hypothetical protein